MNDRLNDFLQIGGSADGARQLVEKRKLFNSSLQALVLLLQGAASSIGNRHDSRIIHNDTSSTMEREVLDNWIIGSLGPINPILHHSNDSPLKLHFSAQRFGPASKSTGDMPLASLVLPSLMA